MILTLAKKKTYASLLYQTTFLVLTLVGCCLRVGGLCHVSQNVATVVGPRTGYFNSWTSFASDKGLEVRHPFSTTDVQHMHVASIELSAGCIALLDEPDLVAALSRPCSKAVSWWLTAIVKPKLLSRHSWYIEYKTHAQTLVCTDYVSK